MNELYERALAEKLQGLGRDLAEKYRHAHPFPHAVIDDFLPAAQLQRALDEFPRPNQRAWIELDNAHEKKRGFETLAEMPPAIRGVVQFLNSPAILRFLEELTGIQGLISDPYCFGGGIHQIERGGHLGIHADFNKHRKLGLDRRVNLLLYVNQDWKEEYGGHLELWDRDMRTCAARVLPVFNRCAIFTTSETSFHGHPQALTCPPDRARRSFAAYYYTSGRPEEEQAPMHSTVWKRRPGEPEPRVDPLRLAKSAVRALLPPLVTDGYRRAKALVSR